MNDNDANQAENAANRKEIDTGLARGGFMLPVWRMAAWLDRCRVRLVAYRECKETDARRRRGWF